MESANRGEGGYCLDEKSTGLQKGNRYCYFEGRTAQAGGVRNNSNECAVLVSKGSADYQGGTGFPRQAEIDQPDLTAAWGVGPNGVRPRTSAAGPYRDSNSAAEAAPISSSSKGPESKGRERRSTSCVKARFSSTGRCSKASSSASVSLLINTPYQPTGGRKGSLFGGCRLRGRATFTSVGQRSSADVAAVWLRLRLFPWALTDICVSENVVAMLRTAEESVG